MCILFFFLPREQRMISVFWLWISLYGNFTVAAVLWTTSPGECQMYHSLQQTKLHTLFSDRPNHTHRSETDKNGRNPSTSKHLWRHVLMKLGTGNKCWAPLNFHRIYMSLWEDPSWLIGWRKHIPTCPRRPSSLQIRCNHKRQVWV